MRAQIVGKIVFFGKIKDARAKTNFVLFKNARAGLILLIGAAIPVIGELLKFIAWILAAVGFFNIKKSSQIKESVDSVISTKKQFCAYCGAPIIPEAAFCQKCGKKIE
jgi:hypothetical protein